MGTEIKERLVYSVYEIVEILGISISSAYQAIERNEIPHVKVGSRILIPKKMLDEWLSKHDQPKPAQVSREELLREVLDSEKE